MKLYTVDLNLKQLKERKSTSTAISKQFSPFKKAIVADEIIKLKVENNNKKRYTLENEKLDNPMRASRLIKFNSIDEQTITSQRLTDPVLASVLEIHNESNKLFRHVFKFGVNSYLQGDWPLSKKFFERSLEMKPNDKPTKVLLNYMKEFNYKSPETWKGCRELTEK